MVSIPLLFEEKRLHAAFFFWGKSYFWGFVGSDQPAGSKTQQLFFFFSTPHENMLTIQNELFLFQYSSFSTIYKIVEKWGVQISIKGVWFMGIIRFWDRSESSREAFVNKRLQLPEALMAGSLLCLYSLKRLPPRGVITVLPTSYWYLTSPIKGDPVSSNRPSLGWRGFWRTQIRGG